MSDGTVERRHFMAAIGTLVAGANPYHRPAPAPPYLRHAGQRPLLTGRLVGRQRRQGEAQRRRPVLAALKDFTPLAPGATDIRPLLGQGGAYSYRHGGAALSSSDHAVRKGVAVKMVPHAIAVVVRILDRAAERLVQ